MRMSSIDNSIPKIGINGLRYDIFSKISADTYMFHNLELLVESFGPVCCSPIIGEPSLILPPSCQTSHWLLFIQNKHLFVSVSQVESSYQSWNPSSHYHNVELLLLSCVGLLAFRKKGGIVSSNYIDWELGSIRISDTHEMISYFFWIWCLSGGELEMNWRYLSQEDS